MLCNELIKVINKNNTNYRVVKLLYIKSRFVNLFEFDFEKF